MSVSILTIEIQMRNLDRFGHSFIIRKSSLLNLPNATLSAQIITVLERVAAASVKKRVLQFVLPVMLLDRRSVILKSKGNFGN